MRVIGLTGSIACGKSTATRILVEEHGAIVIDADVIARRVVRRGEPAFAAIVEAFADVDGLLGDDGELNRRRLGEVVFGDAGRRATLNAITHRHVHREMARQLVAALAAWPRLIVLDIPLLLESPVFGGPARRFLFSAVVAVLLDSTDTQLARLRARDPDLSEGAARDRLGAQMGMGAKRAAADVVWENAGSVDALRRAIAAYVDGDMEATTAVPLGVWVVAAVVLGGAAAVVAVAKWWW